MTVCGYPNPGSGTWGLCGGFTCGWPAAGKDPGTGTPLCRHHLALRHQAVRRDFVAGAPVRASVTRSGVVHTFQRWTATMALAEMRCGVRLGRPIELVDGDSTCQRCLDRT